MATFWRTFHDDGKIIPAWWGWGCTPSPFHSIYHHEQSCGVCSSWGGRYQGVIKRCRLSWLTNSALLNESKCGGIWGRGYGVQANEYSCVHHVTWSPNRLWRSNSLFNLRQTYSPCFSHTPILINEKRNKKSRDTVPLRPIKFNRTFSEFTDNVQNVWKVHCCDI